MRSIAGVGMTPPNVLDTPKPASSVMIRRTFGAPFGGTTRGSQQGFDSRESRLITPPNGFGSGGNCFSDLSDVVPAAEQVSGAGCCAKAPAVTNVVSESAVNAIRRTRAVHRLRIVPVLQNEMYLSSIFANPFRGMNYFGSVLVFTQQKLGKSLDDNAEP